MISPRRAPPMALGALLGVCAVVACIVIAGISAWLLAPNTGQAASAWPGNYFVQGVVRWDAGWYEYIASHGYTYVPGEQGPVAFFPLYPLAIAFVRDLGVDIWLAGVGISALAGIVALALFARWAELLVGPEKALQATLLFALYPCSFYLFGVMYADALFIALTLGAFLALERDRVWLAVLLGALATAARPVAPALVLGLLARRFEQRRARGEGFRPTDALLVFAAAGFVAYVGYLGHAFGDPLAFVHIQGVQGWDQQAGWRTWLKVRWFQAMFPRVTIPVALRLLGHAVATFGVLALVVPTWRRLSWGYGLYVLAVIGMPTLGSKDFMGMGRYALAGFPVFVTLALLLASRPRLHRAWLATSAALWVALVIGFGATGYIS